MSESNENITDDLTSFSVDDEDQLQPGDTLANGDLDDELDVGYSPRDTALGSDAFGTTAEEQARGEGIEDRLRQELPDPNAASDLSGSDDLGASGPDEPDSIAAMDGWVADQEVGNARAGRLVADDEGSHEDEEKEVWARDVGIDGAAASAEEAAMHVIDLDEDDNDVDEDRTVAPDSSSGS